MGRRFRKKFENIGFISTRVAGTDGVSLEIAKWAAVLERNKYETFYFAGELDRPKEKCFLVEEAHFEHPEIQKINEECLGKHCRPPEISELIQNLKDHLKKKMYEFVRQFDIDLIIPENCLAIPMNIPLGLAITEFIAETGFPTLAHHHDFYWERDRFLVNAAQDFLQRAFPPDLPDIRHVVINTLASEQLSHRKGISNTIIPNVYDFASPPKPVDDYCGELRKSVGLGEDDLFILQPTRVVPRKWIERALEIVHHMDQPNKYLIVSHGLQDEGSIYYERITEYAENLRVKIVGIEDRIGPERKINDDGEKIFTLGDVYCCSDLVTYPSGYEGFGNAFLETIYYRRPIVVNRYSIYIVDIEPKGFDVIPIDGFAVSDTFNMINDIMENKDRLAEMVETNYQAGREYFSYEVLERYLLPLVISLEK